MTEGKYLYLECYSGISGDMTVGALLDLGARREVLEKALESLGVEGYHLHFGRKKKCGIDAYDFDVHLEESGWGHGHGQEAQGEHETGEHTHIHEAQEGGCGTGDHGHSHSHPHIHRGLREVYEIIERLDAEDGVKALAKRIFAIVAEAESEAHGIPVEEVHFHEVGAVDSIVDIVGVAVCLHDLGVTRVFVSPLAEGRGYVRCQHGVMPVPVPATANIASRHGLELVLTDNEGEMVTPTGAAIAAALRTEKALPKRYLIEKIGIGAGNKDFKNANILRAMVLCPLEEEQEEAPLWVLETNLDDCTGEALGLAMELLLEEGARDVWYTPAFMKKNRPAYVLHVLCGEDERRRLEQLIFSSTTTIGIRRYQVERTKLERSIKDVKTSLGPVRVKVCSLEDGVRYYPEYESVRAICRETRRGFLEVFHQLMEEAAAAAQEEESAGGRK